MQRRIFCLNAVLIFIGACSIPLWCVRTCIAESFKADVISVSETHQTNTIVRIGDENIPNEWFVHEFRSTFFKYNATNNVRQVIFDRFLDKMLLYVKAKEEGMSDDAKLQEAIADRVDKMRSFMEYQLAMTKVNMIVSEYLKRSGLSLDSYPVSEEDLQRFIDVELSHRPEMPPQTPDQLPPEALSAITMRIRQNKQNEDVAALLEAYKSKVDVEISHKLIEEVVMPKIGPQPSM